MQQREVERRQTVKNGVTEGVRSVGETNIQNTVEICGAGGSVIRLIIPMDPSSGEVPV